MSRFEELAAKQDEAPVDSESVEVLYGGELVTLSFTRMPGEQWVTITEKHPQRDDVPVDKVYHYDIQAAGLEAVPLSGLFEGEALEPEQWARLIVGLEGPHLKNVVYTVWGLNEWQPAERVKALKKASAAGSRKNSRSRGN